MIKRTITITLNEENYEEFIKFCDENYELEKDEDLEEVAIQMLEEESVENLSYCFLVRYEDETW